MTFLELIDTHIAEYQILKGLANYKNPDAQKSLNLKILALKKLQSDWKEEELRK